MIRKKLKILTFPLLVPTAMDTPSISKSAAVRGFSHWILIIIFLVFVSQQTSFLSNPTDKARVSLMGLKVMALTGAQWGVRLKIFLFELQSQKEMTPLSQLVPRNEGWSWINQ